MKIEITNEQYEAFQKGESITIIPPTKEPEQWEPKGGKWFIYGNGGVSSINSSMDYKDFGTERETRESAEKASKIMRLHNRLLAWVDENDDGWFADWDNPNQTKYYVYYTSKTRKYDITSRYNTKVLGIVYMSRPLALKLAEGLNNGTIVL